VDGVILIGKIQTRKLFNPAGHHWTDKRSWFKIIQRHCLHVIKAIEQNLLIRLEALLISYESFISKGWRRLQAPLYGFRHMGMLKHFSR